MLIDVASSQDASNPDHVSMSDSISVITSFASCLISISEKSCRIGFSFSSIINNEYGVNTNVNSVHSSSNQHIPSPAYK